MKVFKKILMAAVAVVVVSFVGCIVENKLNSNYNNLDTVGRFVIREFSDYKKAAEKKPMWKGDKFFDHPVLVLDGALNKAYYFPVKGQSVNSIFATKIKNAPVDVYRLSRVTPQIIGKKMSIGYFNTIGEKYNLFGKDTYYVKLDNKNGINKNYTPQHFMPFLSHEAFHYYMQNEWADGERFDEPYTENDLNLLFDEYDVLDKYQRMRVNGNINKKELKNIARDYVSAMDKRIKANPNYLNKEMSMETAEGSATYVGIKAAKAVDYKFDVMCFNDKAVHVPFSTLRKQYKDKTINMNHLRNIVPYETGALLCFMLDDLGVDNWQDVLNKQTKKKPVYLYDIIKKNVM